MNDCNQLAETGRVHWTAALGHIELKWYMSAHLDNHSSRPITGRNWDLTLAHVACMTTNLVATDDRKLIPAMYKDFLEAFSKAKAETLLLWRSIDHAIDLEPGYNLPYGRITIEWSWVEQDFQFSLVKRYACNGVERDHMLRRPDLAFGWKYPMPYGRITGWVFHYDAQYVTGWIIGLWRRVNGRRTWLISVMMPSKLYREL